MTHQSINVLPDMRRADLRETSWRYAGWTVLLVASAAMVGTLPGRTVGLSLITEPLLSDLQITRTHYANATFWATIMGATFSVGCGRLLDHWGVRNTLSLVIFLLALTTVLIGVSLSPGNLLLLLILCRGFGQSSLSTASVTAVGKWFTTHLGFALAVFSAFVALGFAVAIPLLGRMITPETWRECWVGVGLLLMLLALLTYVLVPQNHRQRVDDEPRLGPSSTRNLALRTPAFWMFSLSTALYYLVLSGLTLFSEDLLAELGFDHDVFIAAMACMMGAGLLGNFLAGWLSMRVLIPRLLSATLLSLAVVLLGIPNLTSTPQVLMLFSIYGICGGAFAVLFFAGYERAFGKTHLGKIQGAAQVLGVVASALGPKLLAETQATTGSYLPALTWWGPLAVLLAGLAWFTPMPVLNNLATKVKQHERSN